MKVRRLAGNAQRRLREAVRQAMKRRFSLFLTAEGWILVGAMLLIGLAALNTGAPLLYLMFSMLCAFFVLSALMATNTIRSLVVRRRVPSVWVAGEPMRGTVRIRNRKQLTASYSLRVQDLLEDGGMLGGAFFDRIPPRNQEASQEYHCFFPRRGLYRLRYLELATRFPFGLIERQLRYDMPQEILVLPQTITIDRTMERARTELGEYEANVKGRGSSLYGLREYTPDLPARDIHWKVSARRGSLMVREYESEEKRRATVILDNRIPESRRQSMEEAFERGVVLAASAVEWLCAHGHEVELRTASGMIGFGAGAAHLTRCRRALARLAPINPAEADAALLVNPEPGIVRFPIVFRGREEVGDGAVPLCVEDFAEELDAALHGPAQPSREVFPQMF